MLIKFSSNLFIFIGFSLQITAVICGELKQSGYQCHPVTIQKVIQLFETKNSRWVSFNVITYLVCQTQMMTVNQFCVP